MTLAVFADLEQKIRDLIDAHAGELEKVTADAQAAAGNPLVRTVLGFAHVSPGMLVILADALAKLDGELGTVLQETAQNAHVAGRNEAAAEMAPAEPAPAEEQPPADPAAAEAAPDGEPLAEPPAE